MRTGGIKSAPERVARHVRDVPRSGIRDFFEIVATRHDIISLGIGEPDFDTPWHVREAIVAALERGGAICHYTSNLGLLRLRRLLAAYVEQTFGLAYQPETEILVTVGVSEGMDLAMRALLNPGEAVLYHEPSFVAYAPLITFAGGTPVRIPTTAADGFKLTAGGLEAAYTPQCKALLLNYPNNPTGAVLDPAELAAIAEFVRARDLLVISDEIYAELSYDAPHTSIASLPGLRERTIFLHGFSKAWAMTGLRMGYACGPADIIDAMMKIHQYSMMSAPTPSQEAACEALMRAEEDIGHMRAEYQRRRNFVVAACAELGLPCVRPAGAFYAFPQIGQLGISSHDFAYRLIEEESVAVVPGPAFGPSGEGYVRCAYATAMEELKEAFARIGRFVKRLG
ncbi:MAG: aminotransferase class I/II-fold pyridoxal phosphate-dependent enzyme [Candidatus Marinimicrobia bacterium]|nr:aminotransferase class I/II-fold pyridoxal phosphate-dependent enzyme [Candidatus Neomarinimicrobiota bacterium]